MKALTSGDAVVGFDRLYDCRRAATAMIGGPTPNTPPVRALSTSLAAQPDGAR